MSHLRATLAAAGIILVTLYCMAIQSVVILVAPSRWRVIPLHYFRTVCRVAGIKVHVHGAPDQSGPLLLVANHVSWMDIVAIGSITPLSFIAKKQIEGWPVIGYMCRLHHAIFVDRDRRQATAHVNRELAARLAAGDTVVLFAEGTSSDGNQVLPFKSAIVGAVEQKAKESGFTDIAAQPLAIAYTRAHGLPIARQQRPFFAWYGDMDLVPHLWGVLGRGPVDVAVSFGRVHHVSEFASRKEMTRALETEVRRMFSAAIQGRAQEAAEVANPPPPYASWPA